ncbi:hypothetical protein [Shumkonia mesophila]|uniref:hypothetical protein n=1 Tax=Shumkonia mesophila TaxID=2838854 RepID=UPI0029343A8A|nr:hypothetical protein [Shumkonia mesophila]
MAFCYQQPLPPAPPVGATPPRLVASAFGVVPLPMDFNIALEGPFNLIAAVYLDVGLYLLLFGAEQPDTNYHVLINDGGLHIAAAEKAAGYIMIAAKDAMETPVDPSSFNVEVYRL